MTVTHCQWCGDPLSAYQMSRRRKRPANFCGERCYFRWWSLENGKMKPEMAALRRLQLRHRDEFRELLEAEAGRADHRPS